MKHTTAKILVFGAGLMAGAGAGYLIAEKSSEKKWSDIAGEEIASVKRTYKLLTDELPEEEQREALIEYNQKIDELNYKYSQQDPDRDLSEDDEEEDDTSSDSDDSVDDEEDAPVELFTVKSVDVTGEVRTKDKPYLITTAEFMEDREDYEKFSITYWEEDDILVDERDEMIPDISGLIGTEFTTRWGDGSDDENILYIRNEKLETDFEVQREQNSFMRDRFGVEPDEGGVERIQRAKRLGE